MDRGFLGLPTVETYYCTDYIAARGEIRKVIVKKVGAKMIEF